MWGDIAIAFTIAFLATFMATPYTIKLAKKLGAIDTPKDERRINKISMARLGGLAVILGFIISIIYLLTVMSIEKNINLLENNYHIKLLGFAMRRISNLHSLLL
jgi:UDP-GlcNAc:undecaprenyl-phosphate GlcNAc-1-phosphate transferase